VLGAFVWHVVVELLGSVGPLDGEVVDDEELAVVLDGPDGPEMSVGPVVGAFVGHVVDDEDGSVGPDDGDVVDEDELGVVLDGPD